MKNFYVIFILSLVFCSCNKSQKFDHYGIFTIGKSGVVELKGFQFEAMRDHFQGSDINNTVSVEMVNSNEPLQLYIFSKNKSDEFTLLTDLKNERGEYVCCFNCGSYSSRPGQVCKTVDFTEKPQDKEEHRLFETKVSPGVYCFMNKATRMGYIFKIL